MFEGWSAQDWSLFIGAVTAAWVAIANPLIQVWIASRTNKKVDASTQAVHEVQETAVVAAKKAEEAKKVAEDTKVEILTAVRNGHH